MSETSVPTMSDIHQAKLDMDDINTFVGSSADQFTDNGGKDRLTVTGITNQAFISNPNKTQISTSNSAIFLNVATNATFNAAVDLSVSVAYRVS